MSFLLAAIAISRKAGVHEFTDEFVNAPQTQRLMQRIRTAFDTEIEAKGWDKIRSRVEVVLDSGRKIIKEADERYRGGPENPLSDEELQGKFTDCAERLLDKDARGNIFRVIDGLENLKDIAELVRALQPS
jgi:2-methylcitrate dehydratase PrpD